MELLFTYPACCIDTALGGIWKFLIGIFSHSRTPNNTPTSSFESAGPSGRGSVFNTPILAKFRDNKDDDKDNENLGPGSHFTEP